MEQRLEQWCKVWGVEHLRLVPTVEFSSRMTTTLGRVFPERNLIRLNAELQGTPLLEEVLCHEFAHLVVYKLHGRHTRPHGPEWRELVEKAGFPARTAVPVQEERTTVNYVHRCAVCQTTRTAKRPMKRWRCRACVEAGLEGRMEITSR